MPHSRQNASKLLLCLAPLLWGFICLLSAFPAALSPQTALAGIGSYYYPLSNPDADHTPLPVVGSTTTYTVQDGDTLLDIARDFDLGYRELRRFYPAQDPWLPPPGLELTIPSQWILPEAEKHEIVINVAEMRLYHYSYQQNRIRTYPVGVGTRTDSTTSGSYLVGEKVRNPVWTVPPSLREKYDFTQLPPGPDNPLGEYWIGLAGTHMGIHGTNFPWSVGRAATHGCIRMYPKDVSKLYPLVRENSQVRIIYEPVKIASRQGKVFVEAHPDIYGRIDDMQASVYRRLRQKDLLSKVDKAELYRALRRKSGLPVDVSASPGLGQR